MGSNQYSFFTGGVDLAASTQKGDPLAKLESYIDFEMFRPLLEEAANRVPARGPGGRPRLDMVRMFKILILQRFITWATSEPSIISATASRSIVSWVWGSATPSQTAARSGVFAKT
jgi:hypothetical protein